MKIVRFENRKGEVEWGALRVDGVVLRLDGGFGDWRETEEVVSVCRLLAPVDPVVIYCVGLNYKAHAEETGKSLPDKPMLFMKAPSSVQHPDLPIELPRQLRSDKVDYEAELAVVIGKRCKNATVDNALEFVAGYTAANDVSARDWQVEWGQGQFVRGKTFDTFCPLGPCLVTPDTLTNPNDLSVISRVNGEMRQSSNTEDMIFSVEELIAFISGSTTLLPGTVILTGTPAGVGVGLKPPCFLKPGDVVEIELSEIGVLRNKVVEERR